MSIIREERIGGQRDVLIYALTYPGLIAFDMSGRLLDRLANGTMSTLRQR